MEFIQRKLSRSIRPLFFCFFISVFIVCTYYVVSNKESNEVIVQSSVVSTPAQTKSTKHKKTLAKVLARADKRRDVLVQNECSCKTQSGENFVINASSTKESKLKGSKMQCMKKQYPKALVVGMTKGGTTALVSFLNGHPKIAARTVRPHDTRYFNHYYEKPYEWYRNLMPCSFPHQITISRSTEYFFTKSVPERIQKFDPSMKIIIIVREPIARAMSQFVMWKYQAEYRIGNASFEDAVTTGASKEIDPSSRLILVSNYQRHMKIWLKYFSLKQILFLDSVTFLNDPVQELNKVEDFLGVERFFTQNNFVYNTKRKKYCLASRDGDVKCQSKKERVATSRYRERLEYQTSKLFQTSKSDVL